MFYNDKGLPKGMALVGFQRDGDAALAADKYDGRFVDNSEWPYPSPSCRPIDVVSERPLRVEIIVNKDAATTSKKTPAAKESPSLPPQPMSLLERMNVAPVKTPVA